MLDYNDILFAEEEYQQERARAEWLATRPICVYCGEPIEDRRAFYYNDEYCCLDHSSQLWEDIKEDFVERI